MPLYRYRCAAGHVTEAMMDMAEYKDRVRCGECRKMAVREYGARVAPAGNWPMESDAMGCGVDEVPAVMARLAESGVKCEFNHRGQAVLTSPGHRRRVARALGLYDRNGGYSDP